VKANIGNVYHEAYVLAYGSPSPDDSTGYDDYLHLIARCKIAGLAAVYFAGYVDCQDDCQDDLDELGE
jgi:hypothetical protein